MSLALKLYPQTVLKVESKNIKAHWHNTRCDHDPTQQSRPCPNPMQTNVSVKPQPGAHSHAKGTLAKYIIRFCRNQLINKWYHMF